MSNLLNPFRFGGQTTLLSHDFAGTDNDAISSLTPDIDTEGNGWVDIKNSAQVDSNRAEGNSIALDAFTCDVATADCVITANIMFQGSRVTYVVCRATDWDNCFGIGINSSGNLVIYEKTTGGNTTLQEDTVNGHTAGVWYEVIVTLNGTSIDAETDGGASVSDTGITTHQTVTKHGWAGMGTAAGDKSYCDDILIQTLP